MTIEEAANLMDYETYVKTGSVCEARAAREDNRARGVLRRNNAQLRDRLPDGRHHGHASAPHNTSGARVLSNDVVR